MKLEEQEIKLFELLLSGYSNEEISKSLNISKQTVKDSIRKLYLKFGVFNRIQASIFYVEYVKK